MVPEIVIHKALVQGIRSVREDSRVIDSMFQNLDQNTLQSLKDVVRKQKINISINYPRADALKLPMITLVLKNEAESHTFLGDIMGTSYNGEPESALTFTSASKGLASSLKGIPKPISNKLSVETYTYSELRNQTTITLHDPSGELLVLGQKSLGDNTLWVVGGTGAGEHYRVLSMSSNVLRLDGKFIATLDSSTKVELRPTSDAEAPIGEPSAIYSSTNINLVRKGANYDAQYQLSIITGNQDETLYLYSIIKSILFSQKAFMESQGITALKISGTDFAPRSDFLPSEAFQRTMNLQFVYPFSFIEEQDSPSSISVGLSAGTGDCGYVTFDVETGNLSSI